MSFVSVAFSLFMLLYAGLMMRFARGVRRVLQQRPPPLAETPPVSVIVAARNEESTIGPCLSRILANHYPDFEIIVVDDFSTDGTAAVVRELQSHIRRGVSPARLRLMSMAAVASAEDSGKSAAIDFGVRSASGDVIITTDADCRVGADWIEKMVAQLTGDTVFVAGPVAFQAGNTWFSKLQALEFLGLMSVGAGGVGSGLPNICSSANLAYRREAYLRLVSERHAGVSSPIDEILLHVLHAENENSIAFCAERGAVVRTDPAHSIRAFVQQRRRWARGGISYPSKTLVGTMSMVWMFYTLMLSLIVGTVVLPSLWTLAVVGLFVKVAVEAALIAPLAKRFGALHQLPLLLPGQLVQIPYVVLIGVSALRGDVKWKDRQTRTV